MFFSKISGLRREENHLLIRREYHTSRFHIHEIKGVQIVDKDGALCTADHFPVRNARALFLLKSGRTKTCYVRKLALRKYRYLQSLLEERQ